MVGRNTYKWRQLAKKVEERLCLYTQIICAEYTIILGTMIIKKIS